MEGRSEFKVGRGICRITVYNTGRRYLILGLLVRSRVLLSVFERFESDFDLVVCDRSMGCF